MRPEFQKNPKFERAEQIQVATERSHSARAANRPATSALPIFLAAVIDVWGCLNKIRFYQIIMWGIHKNFRRKDDCDLNMHVGVHDGHDQDVLLIENRLHTIVGDYAKYETLLSQSNQIIYNATRSTILTSFRNLFSAVPENYDGSSAAWTRDFLELANVVPGLLLTNKLVLYLNQG